MSSNDGIDWKAKYEKKVEELTDVQIEYEEFQISSHDLEAELESELKNVTNDRDAFQRRFEKANEELEALRRKYDVEVVAQSRTSANKQEALNELQMAHDQLAVRVREYEQIKDDLERQVRIQTHRADGLQDQLSAVEEDYIVLKEEYDEYRTNALVKQQRLLDQIRDLKANIKHSTDNNKTASSATTVAGGDSSQTTSPVSVRSFSRRASDSVTHMGTLSEAEKQALREKLLRDITVPSPSSSMRSFVSAVPPVSVKDDSALATTASTTTTTTTTLSTAPAAVAVVGVSSPSNRDRAPSQPLRWTLDKATSGKLQKYNSAPPLAIEQATAVAAAASSSYQTTTTTTTDSPSHRPQSKSVAIDDNFAKKRFIFMLTAGTMFRKYRRNTVTKRLVWCSKTLSHVMWGTPGTKQVRGFVKVAKLTQINPGAPNEPRKIILSTRNQNLELEAFDGHKHRDWMAALRFLMAYREQQNDEWTEICRDHRKLGPINDMYQEQAKFLQQVVTFTRIDDEQRAHECKVCFTTLLDRLQWIHADKSQVGTVMLEDVCDVEDFIRGKPERFIIMAAGRNLVLECAVEVKTQWVNAIRFIVTYTPRLKALSMMTALSSSSSTGSDGGDNSSSNITIS